VGSENARRGLGPPGGPGQRWAAALAGGLLHGAGFNLVLHPWLGPLAPAVALAGLGMILWALRGESVRSGAATGAAAWAAAAAAGLWWLSTVSLLGWVLIAVYWAAMGAVFGAALALLRRALGSLAWAPAAAALWTALELARGWLFTGFPWLLAGSLFAGVPALMAPAEFGGVYAVSFLAVILAALAVARHPAYHWARLGLMALVAAAWAGGGLARVHALEGREAAALRLRAACVQPLVPFKVGPKADKRAQRDEQLALTAEVVPGEAELVVWSETMVPGELLDEAGTLLAPLAREKRCWLLAGGVIHETDAAAQFTGRSFNSAVLVAPDGRTAGRYDKRHLVPFGEYVPLGGHFPGAGTVFEIIGTVFSPGPAGQELPRVDGLPLGLSICFEDVFPDIARDDARRGARLLVNLTNDSWFRRTPQARQHLALAAFRAVETGRPLIRATNTGISAVVEPSGRVTVPPGGGLWEKGLVRMSVRVGPERRTACLAAGDAFALACAGLSLLGAAAGLLRRRPAPRPD
jgi:apolipoprotein N-acyltransferase